VDDIVEDLYDDEDIMMRGKPKNIISSELMSQQPTTTIGMQNSLEDYE